MNTYRKFRVVFLAVMAVAVLAIAGAAFAQDEEVPAFSDGRVNAFDIASPVAIYCTFDYPYADDVNMGVLETIDAWALNGNDVFEKVIDISAADLADAEVTDGETTVLDSGAGYTLYLESDSSLTLASAGYSFNWTPGETASC